MLKKRVKDIKVERKELEEKFLKVEKEKEDMYRKYEMAIEQLRQRTDYKNQVLDDKQNLLQNEYERKEVQLQELVQRSGLD